MANAGDHVRVGISGGSVHCMNTGGDTYCGALQRQGFRARPYVTSQPITCKACLRAGAQ